MKRGGDSLSHCEGGEERARRERRKPEKRIRRKSILLMLKKSNDTLPRPSPPFPWGKNQKVLPSHSCKSENVPSRWLLGTGASCCPGLDRKGAALAKRQNKTAKQPTTKALSDQQQQLQHWSSASVWTHAWLAQSAWCHGGGGRV